MIINRSWGVIVTPLSRSIHVIQILHCQISASVKTKRSKNTQTPKLISSLTARPKLVSIALYQKFKLDHWITQLKSFIGSHYDIWERTPYFTNIVYLCTNSRGGFMVMLFQCPIFWDYYGSFLWAEIEITILSPVVLQEWFCGYYIS